MALKIGSASVSKMYKGSIEVAKCYLGSNLIYSNVAPASPLGSTPLTNSNFISARDLWFTNQAQAEATYGLISDWNTTAVTDMQSAFRVTGVVTNDFNENISSWDMSNVTNISNIFRLQAIFNQPIGVWDTSSVTNMQNAIRQTGAFNQPIANWDMSSVTHINFMFYSASAFNQPIAGWDVSNLASNGAYRIFDNASSFNQNVSSLAIPSTVLSYYGMFQGCTSFNNGGQPLTWDMSNAINTERMFYGATNFNADISSWDVSSVTNMNFMFSGATIFNADISSWDVGNVIYMNSMFYKASAFNQNIGIWNVGSATTMYGTMLQASSFNQNIGAWNIILVTNTLRIIRNTSINTANYDSLLIGWEATLQLAYPSGTGSPNLVLGIGSVQYTSAATSARASLINNFGMTITDGGLI